MNLIHAGMVLVGELMIGFLPGSTRVCPPPMRAESPQIADARTPTIDGLRSPTTTRDPSMVDHPGVLAEPNPAFPGVVQRDAKLHAGFDEGTLTYTRLAPSRPEPCTTSAVHRWSSEPIPLTR